MSLTIDVEEKKQKKKLSPIIQSVIQMGILLVLTLIGIFVMIIALFILIRNMPGSPYMIELGANPSQSQIELINQWGLNKPVISQFFIFLGNLISGNWGESYLIQPGTLVIDLVVEAYCRSFELEFLTFGFSLLLGLIFGVLAYISKDKWYGLIPQAIKRLNWIIFGIGFALLLQFLFSFTLGWLPAGQYYDLNLETIPTVTNFRLIDCLLAGKPDYFWDTIKHLILPVITKGFIMFTFITELTYYIIDFFRTPKEMHYLTGKIGFYLSFIFTTGLFIEIMFSLHGIGTLIFYGFWEIQSFMLSASIYSILLTFFIINFSLNFLLLMIRVIVELVKNSKIEEEMNEPTVDSAQTSKIIMGSTLDENTFLIENCDEVKDEKNKSIGKEIFMNLRRKLFNPLTILGILSLLLIFIVAIFAKLISPYDYELVLGFDKTVEPYAAPSSEHILGVTKFGRDVFSRCLFGIQTAVKVGIISTLIGMPLGVLMGTISAFFGKWVKFIIDTTNGIILFFPGIIFMLCIVMILWGEFSNFYWILGLINLPIATLFTQQAVSYEMKRGDINPLEFSKSNGRKILIRLPNIILSILGVGCLITGLIILTFESINFIGLGDPTIITLGIDINLAQRQIEFAPWAALWPVFWIYYTVLGFTMLGIGLKEE